MQTKVAVETLQKQLQREMQTLLQTKEFAFVRAAQKLEALSPLKVMMRGYGLVYDEEKQVLKKCERCKPWRCCFSSITRWNTRL